MIFPKTLLVNFVPPLTRLISRRSNDAGYSPYGSMCPRHLKRGAYGNLANDPVYWEFHHSHRELSFWISHHTNDSSTYAVLRQVVAHL